jgi:hypothetical protein
MDLLGSLAENNVWTHPIDYFVLYLKSMLAIKFW